MEISSMMLMVICLTVFNFVTVERIEDNTMSSRILQLEQKFVDLQAFNRAQEQKYSAVLSSILSKLTTTTDELTIVKAELNNSKAELHSLKRKQETHQTGFDQFKSKVKSQWNETLCLRSDLILSKSSIQSVNATVTGLKLTLNSTEEALCKVSGDIRIIKSDLKKTNGNFTDIIREVKVLKSDITATTDVEIGLRSSIQSLSSSLNTTALNLQSAQSTLTSVSSIQLAVKSHGEALERDVTELKSNVTQFDHRNSINTGHIQSLSKKLYQLQSMVYFEGLNSGSQGLMVQKDEVWKANHAKGSGLNTTSGCFVAPVPGYYMFWVNALVTFPDNDTTVVVHIKADERTIGFAYGQAVASDSYNYTPINGITVSHVRTGSCVWFTPSRSVTFKRAFSVQGGALLHPFVK